MILKKDPSAKLHHDVEKLADYYHSLYTNENYHWRVPFCMEVLGDNSATKEKLQKLKKELPIEQIYRYPINKEGKTWLGAFAFEPISFMSSVILPLEYDFQRLENLIFA